MSLAPAPSPLWLGSIPRPVVTLAGDELPLPVAATLGPLRVRLEASCPAVCVVDLAVLPETPGITPGTALAVAVDDAALFDGEVVTVEHRLGPDGQHRVRARAFDAAHRMRQAGAVVAHTDLTVAGIAAALASRSGLGCKADAEGPALPRVLQAGESDLALLDRLCADAALWWRLDGDTLRLHRWEPDDVRDVEWGDDLIEAVLTSDSSTPLDTAHTVGWDPVTRRPVTGEATAGQADGADRTATLLTLASADQAGALARAEADRAAAASAHVRVVLRGDAAWRPGIGLRIADQAAPFDGPHLLTSVEHVVDDASGWMTIADSRPVPPPAPPAPLGLGVLPATVADVADPDAAGRVRVTFDTLADAESEWLPVLTLGAGDGKGLYCQPDAGDTVLVLHTRDDPGRGIVLGGLFATASPPDAAGVRSGAVRSFAWGTPDGQHFILDRDGDIARLTNAAGTRIELAEAGMLLHAEADLTIEAPGRRLVIRADTVDFERA